MDFNLKMKRGIWMKEKKEKKKKGFFAEFKEFARRGNVVDMAVGVIIGAAFKAIVDSLVKDIVMPFVGIFIDTSSFSDVIIRIGDAEIMIGSFIAAIVNFLVIALVVFCMVKAINGAHKRFEKKKVEEEKDKPKEPPKPTTDELLTSILEELQKKN